MSMPQLSMRRDLSIPLPKLPPLPEGFTIRTAAEVEDPAAEWESIITPAFGEFQSYSLISNDPGCPPERVFFVEEYSGPAATTTALVEKDNGGIGYIHMVGSNPMYVGHGAGLYAVYAALECLQKMGLKEARLLTDDFRLPAIKTYEKLGFEPIIEPGDVVMASRWKKVHETLAMSFPKKPEVRFLWPDSTAPYTEFSPEQAQPSITCYPIEGSKGAVVVCPGGGYHFKASHEGAPIARMLNQAGISAYVLDYRVAPCHREAPLSDASRAIRVVRAMGYEKVGILGFSAGGNLACCAATLYTAGDPDAADPVERLSSRPDALVSCYSVVSFGKFTHMGSRQMLLGPDADDPELIRRFSAECNVTPDTPPAFIWHTADDDCVPVENSLQLATALSACKVPFALHVFGHGVHGLGLATGSSEVSKWTTMAQAWLKVLNF